VTHTSATLAGRRPSRLEQPGAFQCLILRALELPKNHREVFLLRAIHGHSLTEIAALLGISIDEARIRWKRARRAIGPFEDPEASERAQ